MALLEPIHWEEKELNIRLKQTVLAPEVTAGYPATVSPIPNPSTLALLSPTSDDSGFNSRPLSPIASPSRHSSIESEASSPFYPFLSQHLLAAGGTGFTLGLIDCEKGSMQQLSVPMPEQLLDLPSSLDITAFTLSDISALAVVGDAQLWAGTNNGTVHCFELTPELRLKNHAFITINEPILCISSRSIQSVFPPIIHPSSSLPSTSLTTEVLIGVPYGYIIVLAGESDSKGRLKQPINKLSSRRIVRFTNSPVDCAVKCIAHVRTDNNEEYYWCGCGGSIVVISSSDWKKVRQFNARVGSRHASIKEPFQDIQQLLVTEVGVWSCVSDSSTVCLWDKTSYSLKLHLSYCNTQRSLRLRSDTSFLHYTHPLLFIGTKQGDIMIFKIIETLLPTQENEQNSYPVQRSCEYKFILSTHIGSNPIINILTNNSSSTTNRDILSSTPSSPTSSIINLLIVEGDGDSDTSKLHIFELSLSSPHSLRSSPLSDITVISQSSLRNNSLTPRRLSVVSSSSDFVPLKN